MVEEYKRLRQRDGSGAHKSAWRITVRQLESMIRLSEGMARMYCQDQVQPKHVKEAFRLLNKSIIRVEQPDIHLEEEVEGGEAPQMDVDGEFVNYKARLQFRGWCCKIIACDLRQKNSRMLKSLKMEAFW